MNPGRRRARNARLILLLAGAATCRECGRPLFRPSRRPRDRFDGPRVLYWDGEHACVYRERELRLLARDREMALRLTMGAREKH